MAKIRSFKPDFWTDGKLVQIPFEARLMFMGLWTYACDNGHVEDNPIELKMRIFPADELDVSGLLDVLADKGLIERSDGLLTVLNLGRHQHINKRYFTTCEHCEKPGTPVAQRGTTLHNGEQEKKPVDCDCDGDSDGDKSAVADRFAEFYELYPRREGRGQAARAWKAAIKKTDADAIISAVRSQLPELERTERRFVKLPATWLNGECWDDEITAPADEHPYAHLPAPKNWDALRAEAEASRRGGAS